jgi:two-component system CheB/CheR fusion protein
VASSPSVSDKKEIRRSDALETELSETRDYLQSVQEQHEAASEELQASHEEVQSANEELQSINEELETSKEELESTNEELMTVNEEMTHRNAELSRLNADLSNLHLSVNMPILVLAHNLTIRRFTPSAAKLFNLLATDVGRPLSGARHNLVVSEENQDSVPFPLEDVLREIIDQVSPREEEVRDKDGRYYLLRARPYVASDNKIDGVVLTMTDISALKRFEQEINAGRSYAEAIIRSARDPLVILRADLRVNTANDAFFKTFKTTPDQTEGRLIYELGNGQWEIPQLRAMLEDILSRNSIFNDLEVAHDFDQIGRRTMLLNARRLDQETGMPGMILLAMQDITERQQAEEVSRINHAELQLQAEELTRFNRAAVGREERMIQLKHEINTLCERHGEPARYPLEFDQDRKNGDG